MGRRKLEQDIERLEKEVSDLEARLGGWDGFNDKFIAMVEKEFGPMIDGLCERMASEYFGSYFSSEDLKQEFAEYLLRYTIKRARKLSTVQKVWFPYLKISIRNCYVNLLASCSRAKRTADRTEGYSMEACAKMLHSQFSADSSADPDAELVYREFVKEVRRGLRNDNDWDALEMFNLMVDPKPSALRIARKFSRGTVKIDNKIMSIYFRWSPTKTSYVRGRLKKKVKHLLDVRDVVDGSCTRIRTV